MKNKCILYLDNKGEEIIMKKQSIAIIGVIAFVLAVAVGYALFSET